MKLVEFKLLHHYGFPISFPYYNEDENENDLIYLELKEYIKLIEQGAYLKVFQDITNGHTTMTTTFDIFNDEFKDSKRMIFKNITSYTKKKLEDFQNNIIDILKLLIIAISSLSIFIQINITQLIILIIK